MVVQAEVGAGIRLELKEKAAGAIAAMVAEKEPTSSKTTRLRSSTGLSRQRKYILAAHGEQDCAIC